MNRWSEGNLSVVSSQHCFVDGKKDEVSSVIGWQPDSKSVVEHGFASSGDYWTIRWPELNDDSWPGEGEGIYLGEKWKSATKIRFSGNAYRYEDVTKGKPYVIKCKRVAANAAELFATHAEFMSGGKWTTTDAGDGMKIVDSHILSDDKKLVRIESQKPREGFTTVYGVDPRTKELTLSRFSEDGGFAKWICTGHDDNTWTWKGIKYAPDGTKSGGATLTKAGEHKMEFTIQNDGDSGQFASSVGLLGWDGQKGVVVETMISSNGVTFDATWSGAGDRWVSPTRSMELIDGEYKSSYEERIIEWESDDEFVVLTRNRLLSGKPQPNAKSVFKRIRQQLSLEKDFTWLIGTWRGESKIDREYEGLALEAGQTVQTEETYAWGLDQKFIVLNRILLVEGKAIASATDYIGSDPESGQIKQWGFYSTGGHGNGLWSRVDNDSLALSWTAIDPAGKRDSGKSIHKKVGSDTIEEVTIDRTVDGVKHPNSQEDRPTQNREIEWPL